MIQLQCTLFSNKGYKPMSTVLSIESIQYFHAHKKEVQTQAIQKICAQRYISRYHLKEYGYCKFKARLYKQENENVNEK